MRLRIPAFILYYLHDKSSTPVGAGMPAGCFIIKHNNNKQKQPIALAMGIGETNKKRNRFNDLL
jgi:hypothetical protein